MSQAENLLLPIGRLVNGSLYNGQTTDAENRPLVYKTGPNAGSARIDFYFAVAIKKGTESHWSQTEWGALIHKVGNAGFPQGQARSPDFAWKIDDGDSTIPNKAGKIPAERPGYLGHWILKFSSGFAPQIYNHNGSAALIEKDHVKLGDFIQVYGSVASNDSMQQPGVYLNHKAVAFSGFGERIELGIDAKNIGFGNSPAPAGMSTAPITPAFTSAPVAATAAPLAPPPHTAILTPPKPVTIQMTAKAEGNTYEAFIAQGWTHEMLVQHGYVVT